MILLIDCWHIYQIALIWMSLDHIGDKSTLALLMTSCRQAVSHGPLARYIKLQVAHAPGMRGTFSPPPRVSDPDMHHGTCVTHMSWCMAGSLASGFRWSRWRGKRSRHSRRMHSVQFYVSGLRSITWTNDTQDLRRHRLQRVNIVILDEQHEKMVVTKTGGIIEFYLAANQIDNNPQ